MIIHVNMKQIGKRKNLVEAVPFSYDVAPMTTKDLIIQTVQICVREYNKRFLAGEDYVSSVLTAGEIVGRAEIGKIAFGVVYGKEANESEAIETALQAYLDGIIRIFHGDVELTELEQGIELDEASIVTFIRLTMLAGRIW